MSRLNRTAMFFLLVAVFILSMGSDQALGGLQDRAFATHNVGKVGFFTTNIGQFYPYGGQFEKTLEYPINSGHICMYRQCLMIGAPMNVISAADGRFEEFDAVGGYNAGQGEIAISDNPATWPPWGWPVQDTGGDPVFLSQQDSYCVYSDSTNWRYYNNGEQDMLLDIRIHQTIHTWGVPDADKFIVLKVEIENAGTRPLDELYFNVYSDLDIGGIENATREWADDCVGFDQDRDMVYFYDSDQYSDEWGEADPFMAGVTFLQTPNGQGITDWHWIDVTIDEVAVNNTFYDSLSYSLMKSDTMYFHDHPLLRVSDYFHLGENPSNGTHFDDPATSRIEDGQGNLIGAAMVAYICNGPFSIAPGERAEFWFGIAVGDNQDDLFAVVDKLRTYYADGFRIATIPSPRLRAQGGDRYVKLTWSDSLDIHYVNPASDPPVNDLEGYKIYRTTDPTLSTWDELATLTMAYKDEVLLTEDIYVYEDTGVLNGFTYYYNLTAFRTDTATGRIEESIRLSDLENIENLPNALAIEPKTEAASSASDLDKIRVVPNPYIISAAWDESRLGNSPFGEPVREIAFTHLPSPCTIKIFTAAGDLIQTLAHTDGTGQEEWNLLTSERRPIVSGIYFYHIDSDLGDKIGRFAVIR